MCWAVGACVYICMYMYACICTCLYMCVSVRVCVHVCVCLMESCPFFSPYFSLCVMESGVQLTLLKIKELESPREINKIIERA